MKKRAATPLFSNEHMWVNVTVSCPECGDSTITYRLNTLINEQPDYVCPMCDEPTGQRTIVEADA